MMQLEIIFIEPDDAIGGKVCFRKQGVEVKGGEIKAKVPRFPELKRNLNRIPEQPVRSNKWLVSFRMEESREEKL